MQIGPQVAFVDDFKDQIQPLEDAIQELHTGSIYFDATPERNDFPKVPLETVEILFLDLFYQRSFDPEISALWVKKIIPEHSKYTLVVWSKDTDEVQALLDILDEINLTPALYYLWQKTNYNLEKENFKAKMEDLINEVSYNNRVSHEHFIGEIIEVEEDSVLVNCRISQEPVVFQVRRFDKDLLTNVENLELRKYLIINIYTKPGARLIDIFELKRDLKEEFETQDLFKGLEGGAFFIEG
nr:hypothetical protein [uncultured Sphingobacterium sp.]